MKMIGFDYEVVYRKGTTNVVVNDLSCLAMSEFHVISAFETNLMDKIKTNWLQDAFLQDLIQKLIEHNGIYKKYMW